MYNEGEKTKEDEIGESCCTHERDGKFISNFTRKNL